MTTDLTENLFSRLKVRRQFIIKRLALAAGVTLIFAGLFVFKTFEDLDKKILDFGLSIQTFQKSSVPPVVILSISQKTIDQMGAWPWPNRYHARMLEVLKRLGVKAVYIDDSFSQATFENDDALFAEAIQRAGIPVYFAVDIRKKELNPGQGLGILESDAKDEVWRRPLPLLESRVAGLGHHWIKPDRDGVFRFWKPEIKLQEQTLKIISWEILKNFQPQAVDFSKKTFQENRSELIPWDRAAYQATPRIEYADLLNSFLAEQNGMKPFVRPEIFQGSICWIGLTADNQTLVGYTPWHQKTTRVEVLAALFQGLSQGRFKHALPPEANLLFFMVVILVTLALTSFWEGKKLWVAAGFCMAGVILVPIITFFFFGYGLGIVLPAAFFLSTLICVLVFDAAAGSKERSNLFHLATRDGLTNLYVIRHFRVIMNQVTREARARKEMLAVILMDIDHFKKINDTHGHPAGDMVLKKTAETIQATVRQKRAFKDVDFVARYGGEEFIILIRRSSLENTAANIAERIRKAIEKTHFEWQGNRIFVTTSLGVAALAENENIPDAMVHRADKALYLAKQTGRNRVCTEAMLKTPG